MNILPTDAKERKEYPVYSGLFRYFPRTLAALSRLSLEGAQQHSSFDEDMLPTWDRSKSGDDKDACARHMLDGDWLPVAWRALAVCEKQLEKKVIQEAHDNIDNVTVRGIGSLQGVSPDPDPKALEVLMNNPDFREFLKNQGCLKKWIANFMPAYYQLCVDDGLIAGAFDWSHSKEGYDFWEDLDGKWNYQCK